MGFDGAGPERDSLPTWRGVIITLILVAVVVALIYVGYTLAVSDPRAPSG